MRDPEPLNKNEGGSGDGESQTEQSETQPRSGGTVSKDPRGTGSTTDGLRDGGLPSFLESTRQRPATIQHEKKSAPGSMSLETLTKSQSAHVVLSHEDLAEPSEARREDTMIVAKEAGNRESVAFDKWMQELDEGYNVCLYGPEPGRDVAMKFARHLYRRPETSPWFVLVDGYHPGPLSWNILNALWEFEGKTQLPESPESAVDILLRDYSNRPAEDQVQLIIQGLDHADVGDASTRGLIALIVAHERMSVIATCDAADLSDLWDADTLQQLGFLYHNRTTLGS